MPIARNIHERGVLTLTTGWQVPTKQSNKRDYSYSLPYKHPTLQGGTSEVSRIPREAILTSIVRLKIEQTWTPQMDNWASLWYSEQEATEPWDTPKSRGRWSLWLLPEKSSILPHTQPDRKPVSICPTEKSLAHARKPNVAATWSLMAGHLRRLYPKVCFPLNNYSLSSYLISHLEETVFSNYLLQGSYI